MPAIRHLSKAPIHEAILGFTADISAFWQPQVIRKDLSSRFPGFSEVREQHTFTKEIVFHGTSTEATDSHEIDAFIIQNNDTREALQIRRDGFAFSKLAPY